MKIEINLYEPWMKDQIVNLICNQYNYIPKEYTLFFDKFYDPNYQSNSIKIVALDDKKVVGFQSFFSWPYSHENKTFNSFQSGNSIVHPDYRGKQIFQKMLNYIYERNESFKIDFLIGFPVKASYNSFIRNGWENVFNLQWYLKILNPFSFLFPIDLKKIKTIFPSTAISDEINCNSKIKLSNHPDFINWRKSYSRQKKFYYTFTQDNQTVEFVLKLNKRKKIVPINELIIGEVNTSSYDMLFLQKAFKHLIKEVKRLKFITIISIAINPNNDELQKVLNHLSFKISNHEIYFIIKSFIQKKEIFIQKNWSIYRGDIDTW
jgi:GNAT superfamily N-acetyltransferase